MINTYFYQHPKLPQLELRYSDNNEGCYVMHTHDEYSLGAVLGEPTRYQVQSRNYIIKDGATVLIPPDMPHACNHIAKPNGEWRYLMLYIDKVYWEELCNEFSDVVADGQPIPDAELFQQFIGLHDFWQQQPDDVLGIESAWLMCFQRLCEIDTDKTIDKAVGTAKDKTMLLSAVEWLDTHLNEAFTLSDWGRALGLSRAQLLRLFRQHLQMSPHQYCLNQRIQRAKQLLKRGEALSEIAYQLGFADQAHFQRTFKRYTAITPRQYQRNR